MNTDNWDLIIDSPGRINIIGEHTDYNNGFVLPTAIDKKIEFKFKKNGSKTTCNMHSKNFNTLFSFELDAVAKSDQQWQNYILGVIYEIQQLSDGLQGFDCEFFSDIPVGSGVSSSAALECGMAFGLNEMFKLNLDKLTLVELSQRAEHNYVGTKCGIMDQFASVMSKKDHVILLDCQSLDYEYIPIKIEPYKILLLNTNVSHNLASGEYNIRRSQCEQGVAIIKEKFPQVNSLRDVSIEMLESSKPEIPSVVYNRCLYVVEEKDRVLNSVKALKNRELSKLGDYMYQTHEGLQHLYEVSCPELDFLVGFSKNNDTVIGARMMGGGFGGCTINIIHEDAVESFTEEVSEAYFNKFNIKLTPFEANPSVGTKTA
ncbi:galactokinase [Aureibaculum sp. 2210JD6-5]|uniref:galactokinase n=1 Tax=Aureibaculum sp. 2210JD6-5 TaxID=3103957 RepID=UPI002AAD39EA|nr:galactokinase [Aureibaculum sp. 2210JD6-5]MDY7396955.1 galactokinase [Aureibaculum sp. 2210JD6-5]